MKILFLALFLYIHHLSIGQFKEFNNDWLTPGKNYLKIEIEKDGIYSIGSNELPISFKNLDPKKFSLYYRGKRIKFNIIDKSNNIFYIEFFGKQNDGKFDDYLYEANNQRQNKYSNLFSNNSHYFLAYTPELENNFEEEIEVITKDSEENQMNDFYFLSKSKGFDDEWNYDQQTNFITELSNSYFEPNEALMSNRFLLNEINFKENLILENLLESNSNTIDLDISIGGRNLSKRLLNLKFGNHVNEVVLNNFEIKNLHLETQIHNSESIPIEIGFLNTNSTSVLNGIKYDAFSILGFKFKYRSKPIFNLNRELILQNTEKKFNSIKLEKASNKVFIYDITDIYNQKKLPFLFDSISNSINVTTLSGKNNNIFWIPNEILKPISIKEYDYKISEKFNYLIITDNNLVDGAKQYKLYRESINGGNHKVKIATIESIYNEFSFGEKNPIAINAYLKFYLNTNEINNLLLLGRPLSQPVLCKKNPNLDLVPSIGFPASDILFSAGLLGLNSNLQSIPTGRISAENNNEILIYLDKIKEFENTNTTFSSFQKNFLHLSGGKGEQQVLEFKNFLKSLGEIAYNSKLGAKYIPIFKTKVNDGTQPIDISEYVNKGLGFITFFGHSSVSALDLNIGYASDQNSKLNNSPKYPFMFFNGCGAGNIFGKLTNSLSRDWILAEKRGAIGVLAHSSLSYSNSNNIYMKSFYDLYFSNTSNLNQSIGKIIQITNKSILEKFPNNAFLVANVHQMVLQGDPALRIFNLTKPDYKTEDSDIFLSSKNIQKPIAENDDLNLELVLSNQGLYEVGNKFGIKLEKIFRNGTSSSEHLVFDAIPNSDTLFFNLKKDFNLSKINFTVDPNHIIDEMDEVNNNASITFDWNLLKSTNFYSTASIEDVQNPNLSVTLENGEMPVNNFEALANQIFKIKLIDNFVLGSKSDKLNAYLLKLCDGCNESPKLVSLTNFSGGEKEIYADLSLKNLQPGSYLLTVQGFDAKKNPSGEVYSLKFVVIEDEKNIDVIKVYPNPASIYTQFDIKTNQEYDKFNLQISNASGILIYQSEGDLSYGKANIFWNTKTTQNENLANGLYNYRLNYIKTNNIKKTKTGKIVLNH